MQVMYAEQTGTVPNAGGQQAFAEDWVHFIVGLEGGWWSGKTWAGARKLAQLHAWNAFDDRGQATFIPHLVVAPTYANALDFCVPELFTAFEEMNLLYTYKATGALGLGKLAAPGLILPELGTKLNPSVILVRSADVPKRITGFTVGGAWGDEPARWKADSNDPQNDAYTQIMGRIRGRARIKQAIFTYTNEGDATKIYNELRDGNPNKKLYRAATSSNPVAKDFEQMQREILTEELADQYLDGGALLTKGGRVYNKFDFDTHVKSRLQYRQGLSIQLSFDFNIMPGMHVEIGQYHPDSDVFTEIDEIYGPRLTVEGAIERLLVLLREHSIVVSKELPIEIYGDATGGSEWSGTGESNYQIIQQRLKEQGLEYVRRVPKSNPLIVDRVNAVNCALLDTRGCVHYFISVRCRRLIEDLKKMHYNESGEIETKDRKLSHASSAIGYRVHWIRPIKIQRSEIGGQFNV